MGLNSCDVHRLSVATCCRWYQLTSCSDCNTGSFCPAMQDADELAQHFSLASIVKEELDMLSSGTEDPARRKACILNTSSTAPISSNGDRLVPNVTTRTPSAVVKVRVQCSPNRAKWPAHTEKEQTHLPGLSVLVVYQTELFNHSEKPDNKKHEKKE